MKKMNKKYNTTLKTVSSSLYLLPTPTNINYFWNFGSLLGLILFTQILTGILISMHFSATLSTAFYSVIHIMRDTNLGWNLRNIHMNGASMFFLFIFLHIFRSLSNSSFKNHMTWNSGILILLILMGTAFVGYVLPWGQMSFWGATVITNLVSTIPYAGKAIVEWLWGGFSVGEPTLNRFFSFHFFLPFILMAMVGFHLISLHEQGSSNPSTSNSNLDKSEFTPFFYWKDTIGFISAIFLLVMLSVLSPNYFGDPENFNSANPLSTPIHIQPEWYFLFAYAILRSIPNKLGGVLALLMSILILFLLPMTSSKLPIQSKFSSLKKWAISSFVICFFILTWIGAQVVEPPYENIGRWFSILYFIFILMI